MSNSSTTSRPSSRGSRSSSPRGLLLFSYLVAAAILWLVLSAWVNFLFLAPNTAHGDGSLLELPLQSSSSTRNGTLQQTNFSGILARAFEPWPEDLTLPCFSPGDPWDALTPITKGLMFPKPIKCGGSTVAGILLRMARNIAKRQVSLDTSSSLYEICRVRGFQHARPYKYFANRSRSQSFLFSVLREPTSRAISHFFHMVVSREHVQPTDANFRSAIEKDTIFVQDYLIEAHSLSRFSAGRKDAMEVANRIMRDYDFLGITERMDESAVALQLLLGLRTGDVLYLDAKTNGGFDDGGYNNECYFIVPKYVSPGMKEYFASGEWQALVKWDTALYQAANRSLDMTIDRIGRLRFETELARFQWAKQVVTERCGSVARYPCSAGGEKQEHNCLYLDSGCAYECIDQVVSELHL